MKHYSKSIFLSFSLFCIFGFLISCGDSSSKNSSSNGEDISQTSETTETQSPTTDMIPSTSSSSNDTSLIEELKSVRFHYRNADFIKNSQYEAFDVWTWTWTNVDGGSKAVNWSGYDTYGAYVDLTLSNYNAPNNIGLIVRDKGKWGGFQTTDTTIKATNYLINGSRSEVWALLNADLSLSLYNDSDSGLADRIISAYFTSLSNVKVTASYKIKECSIYCNEELVIKKTGSSNTINISLPIQADIRQTYIAKASFETSSIISSRAITCNNLYETDEFKNAFTYNGNDPLGLSFDSLLKTITFRIWAPICSNVQLIIYTSGTPTSVDAHIGSDEIYATYNLTYKQKGIYEYVSEEDLTGKFYTYKVKNYLGTNEVVDPYAVSCGINGLRGYIVDLNSDTTKVDGWDDFTLPKISSNKELTVYELHVEDLTSDSTWTGPNYKRGKYLGLVEKNTSYTENGASVKTGFDHINELGVNAVQLLPIFDSDNEERAKYNEYNWGYNPLNYNAPEGCYSSNPTNPLIKIKELRSAILGFSKTDVGTRTIMDVVYNHISNANNSNFNKITPGYFFRYNSDGSLKNGTGCGNEIKTEAPMMSRFIVDSLVHWAKDYNIKGFRFDLMGIIDCKTLKTAAEELYKIDPTITCYGEAWLASGSWEDAVNNKQAVSDNVYKYLYGYTSGGSTSQPSWDTYSRISVGCFNDTGRDSVRGKNSQDQNSYPDYGFISQGESDFDQNKVNNIYDMIKGIHTNKGSNPNQVMNYLSCHDNYTLYDQLNYCLGGGITKPSPSVVSKAVISSYSSILFSEGMTFIQSGDEFMRSKETKAGEDYSVNMYGKYISHNSYKSDSSVNALHYDLKISQINTFDKFLELVDLRAKLQTSILSYGLSNNTNSNNIWSWGDSINCGYGVGYKFNDDEYYLLSLSRITASSSTIGIGNGKVEIIFDSQDTYKKGDSITIINNKITLNRYETLLLKRIS